MFLDTYGSAIWNTGIIVVFLILVGVLARIQRKDYILWGGCKSREDLILFLVGCEKRPRSYRSTILR